MITFEEIKKVLEAEKAKKDLENAQIEIDRLRSQLSSVLDKIGNKWWPKVKYLLLINVLDNLFHFLFRDVQELQDKYLMESQSLSKYYMK